MYTLLCRTLFYLDWVVKIHWWIYNPLWELIMPGMGKVFKVFKISQQIDNFQSKSSKYDWWMDYFDHLITDHFPIKHVIHSMRASIKMFWSDQEGCVHQSRDHTDNLKVHQVLIFEKQFTGSRFWEAIHRFQLLRNNLQVPICEKQFISTLCRKKAHSIVYIQCWSGNDCLCSCNRESKRTEDSLQELHNRDSNEQESKCPLQQASGSVGCTPGQRSRS